VRAHKRTQLHTCAHISTHLHTCAHMCTQTTAHNSTQPHATAHISTQQYTLTYSLSRSRHHKLHPRPSPSAISINKQGDDAPNRVGFSSLAPVQRPASPRSLQNAMVLIVEGRMSKKSSRIAPFSASNAPLKGPTVRHDGDRV
jgi:hypothetical protein